MSTNKKPHRVGARKPRHKEAFYIRIPMPDDESQFIPATDFIGQKMPVARALETCAMRVYPDVACFSILHLTKARSAAMREDTLEMPDGPLARLARRSTIFGEHLKDDAVIVERGHTVAGLKIERDTNGVISLEKGELPDMPSFHHDNEPDEKGNLGSFAGPDGKHVPALNVADADDIFERDRRGERISVFFRSPVANRVVALGFLGHLPGRPGGNETLARASSMVLQAAIALAEFAFLADAKAVDIPTIAGGGVVSAPPQLQSTTYSMPVELFTDGDLSPVAAGEVELKVDLTHIGNTGSRLLCSVTPDESLAEHWEAYAMVTAEWLDTKLPVVLGDDRESIIGEIVMGSVDDGTIARLRDCLERLPRVRFTPTLCHETPRS